MNKAEASAEDAFRREREAYERLEQKYNQLQADHEKLRKALPISNKSTKPLMICGHPPSRVIHDILEGACSDFKGIGSGVQWCARCGAYRLWQQYKHDLRARNSKLEQATEYGAWFCPDYK